MNLVDPFLTRNENLEEDFAIGRFLLRVPELLPRKIPVGVEPAGVTGCEEKPTGPVTFRQVAEKLKFRGGFPGGGRAEGLENKFVSGMVHRERDVPQTGGGTVGLIFWADFFGHVFDG